MKTATKSAKKSSAMSHARRSEIARKAAKSAWKTMNSAAYKRAAAKSKKAVQTYLANRAA